MNEPMVETVSIKDIVPSPYQLRQQMNPQTISELAAEIKNVGLWSGALRGRRLEDGKIQLCFGHRRLEAIKSLKWKTVDVEILSLTDIQMIQQGLVENLQRDGLTDFERAKGILLLQQMIEPNSPPGELSKLLGLAQ